MKKVPTAVVALALGMSEVAIREACDNAKEIDFAEAFKLMHNPKLKRHTEEAAKLKDQLERFNKIMEE
jgi:hypothetical protein